jgi:dihydropteroate synthase
LLLLEPVGLLHGPTASDAIAAGLALPLAGGPSAFSLVRVVDEGRTLPVGSVPRSYEATLARLTQAPPAWAGLPASRPLVMGIINVTPDSFSNGGDHLDPDRAIEAGLAMVAAGADVIDVGGETTRPGSDPTPPAEEQARILPVIAALAEAGIVLSVDTRNASTMAAALDRGARIFNDVSGLQHDPESARLAAARGCPVVLMHMRGDPATMQSLTAYDDVAVDVANELAGRLRHAEEAGIDRARVALDPGIGFAKGPGDNEALLAHLPLLLSLGCPLLVGVSRKGFIGRLSGEASPRKRVPGSLATALHAVLHGATILRVHDVPETVQAVRVWRGLTGLG